MQNTTIEISKEYLHFAAAHFTLFSDTERENLHGHNFQVTLDAEAAIAEDGLTFDYNILKKALKQMCDDLDEQVIMPTQSPHLQIWTLGKSWMRYRSSEFCYERIIYQSSFSANRTLGKCWEV